MYKDIKIKIIPKKEKKKMTEEEKKQISEKLKQERANRKPFKPYLKLFDELQIKYNAETFRQNYANVEEVIEKMKEELEEKYDEIVDEADEKDIELDDDIYEEIETDIENYYKKLRTKAKEQEDK